MGIFNFFKKGRDKTTHTRCSICTKQVSITMIEDYVCSNCREFLSDESMKKIKNQKPWSKLTTKNKINQIKELRKAMLEAGLSIEDEAKEKEREKFLKESTESVENNPYYNDFEKALGEEFYAIAEELDKEAAEEDIQEAGQDGDLKEEGGYKDGKKEGLWKYYFEKGILFSEVNFKNGLENGLSKVYNKDGTLYQKFYMKNGKEDGPYEHYGKNGKLSLKGYYKDGKLEGALKSYNEDGTLREERTFKDGEELTKP